MPKPACLARAAAVPHALVMRAIMSSGISCTVSPLGMVKLLGP